MYTRKMIISYSYGDMNAKLSIVRVTDIIQDAVSEYLSAIGKDNIILKQENHSIWVFTRNRIVFEKPIAWKEEVTLEVRPVRMGSMKFVVETDIKDDRGLLLYALTEMCLIDMTSYKILPLSSVNLQKTIVEPTGNEAIFPVVTDDGFVPKMKARADSTMLDYSHHVNNSEYMKMALSLLSEEELSSLKPRGLDISYYYQAKEGNFLTIQTKEVDNILAFLISNQDKRSVTKILIIF